MRARVLALSSMVAAAAGCSNPTEPQMHKVLAVIAGFAEDDPHIHIAGSKQGIGITVRTYASGCHSMGSTEVVRDGMRIDVRPYDLEPPDGTPCTRDLQQFQHSVQVSVTTTGEYTVTVHGLRSPHEDTITVRRSAYVNVDD